MARKFIILLNECSLDDKLLLGGKGANLGELMSAGFAVPPGFGLSSSCYDAFLSANGIETDVLRQMIKATDFEDFKQVETVTNRIKDSICSGNIPEDMAEEIRDAYLSLGDSPSVAVRSSSAVPDVGISSFPGQMDTFYHVQGIESVLNHIKLCWASFWNPRAASDRWNKGVDHFAVKVSVVVQQMVLSDYSGVAFTANPVSLNRDEIVIEAIPGLGEDLVSGKTTPDSFLLDRETLAFIKQPEQPGISDKRIVTVAETARRIDTHYGRPQDIEWSFEGENLYILQSRDIVSKSGHPVDYRGLEKWNKAPESDEAEIVWTRAWSDEVLTRAITPLFYSVQAELITATYDFMYRCFGLKELLPLKVMRFHKNRGYFSTRYLMKCLAYVPGFLRSDDLLKFFTPTQKKEAIGAPFFLWKKLWSEIRLLLFYHKYSFTHCYKTYYDHWLPELLSRTKELNSMALEDAGPEQIERYFQGMDRLIKEHCKPIGFGVMIHTLGAITILEMVLKRWLGDTGQIGFLLSGIPGNRTFEANSDTWRMSREINATPRLKALFTDHPAPRIMASMDETEEGRAFLKRMEAFIKTYDFRGAEDREILFPRWGDDPTLLIDVLKLLVQADDETGPDAVEKRNMAKREKVTRNILETLSRQRFGPIKKKIFLFLLKYAQIYSLFRENQRYEIDRVFYGERKAFVAAGKQLVRRGVLTDPDDVWFLSKEEVFDALWDRIMPDEVMAAIVPRKAEYRRYTKMTPPMFIQGDREFDPLSEEKTTLESPDASTSLTGVAASPGQVTGKARVIHSLRELSRIKPGDILVTNSTDPGWSSVFLLIKGLVLETGGVLAHGTVLSREYGLPAVTSVLNATRIIKEGDTITVDGRVGSVSIAAGA